MLRSDKQTPISLPEICAPRYALMRSYNLLAQKHYVFVEAPGGYGKTVTTLLWIKQANKTAIWVALDRYDNSLPLFYRLFCTTLLASITHEPELLALVNSAQFSTSPVEYTLEILSRLTYSDEAYAFVLDDFHVIHSDEIIKSLPYVLARLPITITIIILSRNALPYAFETTKLKDKIAIMGSDALAFSSDEIKAHFASYGRMITDKEAEHIFNYTDGWIIALNTMAKSANYSTDFGNAELSFNSFFEKYIWRKLDEETQWFLLKTCLVDEFSPELCALLSEHPACDDMLSSLISSNINILQAGDQYRYHNLLQDFLKEQLSKSNIDKRQLYTIAANYYVAKNDFPTACRYAFKSADNDTVVQVIRRYMDSSKPTLQDYVEVFAMLNKEKSPSLIYDQLPGLWVPSLFCAFLFGDADTTEYFFDKFYNQIFELTKSNPYLVETAITRIMLDYRIKLSQFPSFVLSLSPYISKIKPREVASVTMQMPFLHRSVRDFYEMLDPKIRRMIKRLFSRVLKDCDIFELGVELGHAIEQNKLREAQKIAIQVQKIWVTKGAAHEIAYAVHISFAELYLMQGEKEKYEAKIVEIKEYITKWQAHYLMKNLIAYEVRTKIWDGDKLAARTWLDHYFVNDHDLEEFFKIYQNFTTVRAYILLGDINKAVTGLGKIKTMGERYRRPLDIAEANVLLSIVEWVSGKKKEAQTRLTDVLLSMQPHGFIRVIANEGKAVLPILSTIIKSIEQHKEQTTGVYKFANTVYYAAYEQSQRFQGLTLNHAFKPVKLSPRQTHILNLIASGYKNAEIVEITGLSLNTIRTHTKIAYQKLEVNNAMDALVKAKRLGIID